MSFTASDCQNVTNMWFSIEDLGKKNAIGFIVLSLFASGTGKTYLYYKITENRFLALPEAKRGNFKKAMAFLAREA